MSYRTQKATTRDLQTIVNAALRVTMHSHKNKLKALWRLCRRDLISAIIIAYKDVAPRGRWTARVFRASGVEGNLRAYIKRRMMIFRAESVVAMRKAFVDIRHKSAARHAWMLDQVTPESKQVKIPHNLVMEAQRLGDPEIWVDRWGQWIESYESALHNNVTMHAMNEGSLEGAVDEVDATRMNTPAVNMETAMLRLMDYKSYEALAEGEDDIAQLNDDLIQEEIWMTSGRANICDECKDNEGKTADEADGDIPLHPNCGCFWEMHPKRYIDLLRSGDPADRAAAEAMERQGLDGGSLVIRDSEGNLAARAVMSFSAWQDKIIGVLTGGMR